MLGHCESSKGGWYQQKRRRSTAAAPLWKSEPRTAPYVYFIDWILDQEEEEKRHIGSGALTL